MQVPCQTIRSSRPSWRDTQRARWRSGAKISGWSPNDFAIFTAFDEVQMRSLIAFTSALQLMYESTFAPGWASTNSWNSSGGQPSASEQPASRSGTTTIRSGFRIFAVSAMKWTPQNAITSRSTFVAAWASASESPTKSARSCTSDSW